MTFHPFEKRVERFILDKSLLESGERVLIAVSGGPDSVALFACLVSLRAKWHWKLSIAHVDHGLRGEESAADADFVRVLGESWQVPVVVRSLSLQKRHAQVVKQSFQEYARNIRYRVLHEMALDLNATKIALGHQADDQAETVLMWMVRGSGTGGLGGMSPKRHGMIVRPLLDQTKSEVFEYLDSKGMTFRTDSTNAKSVYLRNRIRQKLIPLLQEYSPGIVKVVSRQANIVRDDHAFLEHMAGQVVASHCLVGQECVQVSREVVVNLPMPIQRRVMRMCIQRVLATEHWPRFDMVQRILDQLAFGRPGWSIDSHGVRVSQENDIVRIQSGASFNNWGSDDSDKPDITLSIPGEVVWPLTGQKIWLSEYKNLGQMAPPHSFETRLDRRTFSTPLIVRCWRPGDFFYPKGFGGKRKKLQDFFSDIKLPRSQRSQVPLLVAPEGIVCVGALRADERFQATINTTSSVLANIYTTKF